MKLMMTFDLHQTDLAVAPPPLPLVACWPMLFCDEFYIATLFHPFETFRCRTPTGLLQLFENPIACMIIQERKLCAKKLTFCETTFYLFITFFFYSFFNFNLKINKVFIRSKESHERYRSDVF
jgi:hypothetical protein